MRDEIDFNAESYEFGLGVVPIIHGVPLTSRVAAYERDRDYDLPGTYVGVPAYWLRLDFEQGTKGLGYFDTSDYVELLTCNGCFELGCWPLEAKIAVDSETVTWSGFRQPHRRRQTYEGFGPFTFERSDYERAVDQLRSRLAQSE